MLVTDAGPSLSWNGVSEVPPRLRSIRSAQRPSRQRFRALTAVTHPQAPVGTTLMKLAATLTASIVAFSLAAPARAQWSQTHGPEAGRVAQISVNPADGHVFAIGSESLFRSRDGGATWTPLFNGLSGNVLLGAVTASGSVAYLVGYPPNGTAVYRSIDDGDSWTAM